MAFANSTTATTDISSVIASYSTTNFDWFVIINSKCSHFSFNHDQDHALY